MARAEPLLQSRATALTALAYAALIPVLLLGRAHLRPHSLGGLYEKLFLAIELVWLLVVWASIVSPRERRPAPALAAG